MALNVNTVTRVQDYARAGETVPVRVTVENLESKALYIMPTINWSVQAFIPSIPNIQKSLDWMLLAAKSKANFDFSFPMYDLEPTMYVLAAAGSWVVDCGYVNGVWVCGEVMSSSVPTYRQVRAEVLNPYYTVKILNPPAGIYAWYFQYMNGIYGVQSGALNPGTIWRSPWAPMNTQVTYRIIVYGEYSGPPGFNYLLDNQGTIILRAGKDYVYDCATRTMREIGVPVVDGELVIAYVWWEGKEGWSQILESNSWPAKTAITTTWKIRNTGTETAFFKVRFMGLTSAGVQLASGEEATAYLYPTTPGPGTYQYVAEVLADSEVVASYPISVTLAGIVPSPEFSGFGITEYVKS